MSREKIRREDADARKGRKVAKQLAKAAGAEPAGQIRDQKLHALVTRNTFPTQNVQKHQGFRPLLEVEMSKKCTPL